MRTIAIAAAALVALGASVPATAQFPRNFGNDYRATQEIERRLDMIYERIERARQTRELSNRDALQLHGYGQRIFDRYRFLRSDGLDMWEYQQLSRATRALRERVQQALRYGQDWRYGERRGEDWRGRDWERRDRADRDWNEDWDDDWTARDRSGDDRWGQNEQRDRRERWEDDNGQSGNEPNTDYDQDDWWLPPEERERIDTRPGDYPGDG